MPMSHRIGIGIGIGWLLLVVGFYGEGKTRVPGEKALCRSKGENQQQTQPTYGVDATIKREKTIK